MKHLLINTFLLLIPTFFGCKSESWAPPEEPQIKAPEISLGLKEDTKCGLLLGSVILAGNGGHGSYKFHSPEFGENHSGLFTDLPAGNHLFVLTDEHGDSDSLNVLIANEDGVVIESINLTQPNPADSDWSIRVFSKGGKQPLVYQLDNGLFQTGKMFDHLSEGIHRVKVVDANGCEFSQPIVVGKGVKKHLNNEILASVP